MYPSETSSETPSDEGTSRIGTSDSTTKRTPRVWAIALVAAILGGMIGAGAAAGAFYALTRAGVADVRKPSAGVIHNGVTSTTIDVVDEDVSWAEAVAAKVTPSVVSVAVEQDGYNPFTRETVTQKVGNGSGVIIRSDGYVITNYHVIEGADRITVAVGVDELPAQVVGTDPSSDLAVLKVARTDLPAIEIGSSADLKVGQAVVAVGSPFGLDQSVTTGIVSALGRTSFAETAGSQLTAYTSLIQTDAAINPGNSGGALTDAAGRLIGINTLIKTGSQGVAQSAGVGFAIPVDYAAAVAQDLIESGVAHHPYLGVSSLTINARAAALYRLPVDAGVLVDAVEAGSPAASAGIAAGDIIVKIGDTTITSVEEVFMAVRSHAVGDVVSVGIVRGSTRLTVDVTLASDAGRSSSAR